MTTPSRPDLAPLRQAIADTRALHARALDDKTARAQRLGVPLEALPDPDPFLLLRAQVEILRAVTVLTDIEGRP